MTDHNFSCDVAIVGAGLAGLTCAQLLCAAGLKIAVLEAANRIGGRIQSATHQTTGAYEADLGPTWVWPTYQPTVTAMLEGLNIDTFSQHEDGDALLDMDERTPVHRHPLPGQHGIRRLHGGPQALIDRLSTRLPKGVVRTGHPVTSIEANPTALSITIGGGSIPSLTATHVVVAVPPRLAAQNIAWSPSLDPALSTQMADTPTWMAAQAKAVMLYDRPFWRTQGLSGRVASRVGPLVEIHDHSTPDGKKAALFGFVGWPHTARRSEPAALREGIKRQLVRCFGDEGGAYNTLRIEDWATNPTICADLDLSRPPSHPEITSDNLRAPNYDGRLFFSVAETASQSPGLIDGALSAATDTASRLIATFRKESTAPP